MPATRLAIIGASGMVGGEALALALAHPDVTQVTAIGRRHLDLEHPKLCQVHHADFTDCAGLTRVLADHDAALFCLGAYTGAVPDDVFRQITVDMPVSFAATLQAANPQARLAFLSGAGADRAERSRMAFARYKGAAENALLSLGLDDLSIYRPAYIYPVVPRAEPNLAYRLSRWLYPLLRRIAPNAVVPSRDLARAMLRGVLEGAPETTLENPAIRAFGAQETP